MAGLAWKESYRQREIRLSVSRKARCRCGMMVSADTAGHGRLFEPLCHEKPKRGPWRYTATAHFGSMWIRPETLPADVHTELMRLRKEAGQHRRATWARIQGDRIVARWDA